jgi:hypothetical protein
MNFNRLTLLTYLRTFYVFQRAYFTYLLTYLLTWADNGAALFILIDLLTLGD